MFNDVGVKKDFLVPNSTNYKQRKNDVITLQQYKIFSTKETLENEKENHSMRENIHTSYMSIKCLIP